MTDHLILLAFGGTFIASVALFFNFMRGVRLEGEAVAWTGLLHNNGFVLALSLLVSTVGMMGVCLIRTIDGLNGMDLGGSSPLGLLISILLLWGSSSGFHWAATLKRARWQWRMYLALIVVWTALLAWQRLGGD